jgi:hypothetical protein
MFAVRNARRGLYTALLGMLGLTATIDATSQATAPSATGAANVSNHDAAAGLRTALSQGVDKAISLLGSKDGFLSNPKYAIPLPAALDKADKALRLVGMSGDADQLRVAMNRAAEMAVADARPVFKSAVQHMSVQDAKGIVTGGDDAATQYFKRATHSDLLVRFKPIVARETAKLRLGSLYDQYAGKASQLGLLKREDANVNDYVTGKALDSLFDVIAAEERAIRKDPMGQASSLLRRVFGSG